MYEDSSEAAALIYSDRSRRLWASATVHSNVEQDNKQTRSALKVAKVYLNCG